MKRLMVITGVLFIALSLASYGCSKKVVKEEGAGGIAQTQEGAGAEADKHKYSSGSSQLAASDLEKMKMTEPVKSEPVMTSKVEKENKAGSSPMAEGSAEKMVKAEPVKSEPVMAKDELTALVEKEGKLYTIYFEFDRSFIRDDMKSFLEKNAAWLKKNSAVKVKIEGHCDERGSNEYNIALGDRRAQSANKYLVNLGVDASRVSTVSYGEEKSACSAHGEDCWSKNRRAEFVVAR